MSEIPLHTFGRSRKARAGYTPLHNGEPGDEDYENSSSNMRASLGAAAAGASNNRKGKRRERYADDPDEEVTLLGDASREDGGYLDGEPEERREPSAQVRKDFIHPLLAHEPEDYLVRAFLSTCLRTRPYRMGLR